MGRKFPAEHQNPHDRPSFPFPQDPIRRIPLLFMINKTGKEKQPGAWMPAAPLHPSGNRETVAGKGTSAGCPNREMARSLAVVKGQPDRDSVGIRPENPVTDMGGDLHTFTGLQD
jgi:hypothetical protein